MLRYALVSRPEAGSKLRKANAESSVSATFSEDPSSGDLKQHLGFPGSQDTVRTVSQLSSNPFTQDPAKPLADLTEEHRSVDLHSSQKENTRSIPSSGASHLNPSGELAGVLLKLRAQPQPGSPLTGGGVTTRGRIHVESASSPNRKYSQESSPTRHRAPQFREPNLRAKPIYPPIGANASSKKSPGKSKSTPTVPLQPEDERIPYFLRLTTLQKENTSDVTYISPSFIKIGRAHV